LQDTTSTTLTAEVEKKLDNLFQEEEPEELEQGEVQIDESSDPQSPLASLKSIVLSLDWEITDEAMEDFLGQTESLRQRCEKDQVLKTFIQILQALGKYIIKHKGKSHPDAMRLLNTSFENFEKAFEEKSLSETERKALLDQTIAEFVHLKQTIAQRRLGHREAEKRPMLDVEPIKAILRETMQEFVEEVRALLKDELEQIRADLKALHKEHIGTAYQGDHEG